MNTIYQVVCDHNRYGEWIGGTYDNEEAAKKHKEWSDKKLDGWGNFSPAEIREVEIASEFDPAEAERINEKEGPP